MPEVVPAAPAQPSTPEPVAPLTAVDHAVVGDDVAAYRSARAAERSGKPLAPVAPVTPAVDDDADDEPAPVAATPGAPAPVRTVSKRQQQINDYERQIAEQKLEIARLTGRTEAQTARPTHEPVKPVAPTVADHKRFAAMPDAPKEDAFETYSEYTAALSLFIADKRYDERDAQRREREQQTDTQKALASRDEAFRGRVEKARAADPTFDTRVTAEIKALAPIEAVRAAGQPVTSLNALASEFLDNDLGPELMIHFSEHPADLQRFARLQPRDFLRELGKLEATLTAAPAPLADPPKTVSSAPAPPVTLGSRPADTASPLDSAVASGDVAAYREAKLAQRRAAQR